MRTKLDEITENWGGKITRVEIREITPPRDILESMNRMLSAERTRRAVITESEGARQSAINVAEGQKQSEILKAEGERQAAILRAEGFSEALTRIFNAATGVDQKTMTLQYLEALKQIGASPSTKYVIPIEFTRLLEPIREYIAPTDDDGEVAASAPLRAGSPDRAAAADRGVRRRGIIAAGAVAAVTLPAAGYRYLTRRGARRLLDAPRTQAGEEELGPAIDAMGGEVVRLRSRDGLRLSGRWLPSVPPKGRRTKSKWVPDPHEAIVLLHGWSGSVAPDIVEYAPFLRRIAGVLALDFRGHGESDDAPTTFGMREVEDVAGALAWLGERGIERVALFGTSMGGIDRDRRGRRARRRLASGRGHGPRRAGRRRPGAAAADRRRRGGFGAAGAGGRRSARGSRGRSGALAADRMLAAAARDLGGDPRDTEPIRMVGLVEPVPLLLIHGEADRTVPLADGRRLAAAAGPSAQHWTVPGADHSAFACDHAPGVRGVRDGRGTFRLPARTGRQPIIAAPPGRKRSRQRAYRHA